MTERYITGVWTRWSDGEMIYWKGGPDRVRSKSDNFIYRAVTRMVLRLNDLTVRSLGRWGQMTLNPLLSKGYDLSDDLPP
jgi:hypothetical protein